MYTLLNLYLHINTQLVQAAWAVNISNIKEDDLNGCPYIVNIYYKYLMTSQHKCCLFGFS